MKRSIFKLTLFVLVGAIINVAVVWVINLFGWTIPFDHHRKLDNETLLDLWSKHVPSEWPVVTHREGSARVYWGTGVTHVFILADEKSIARATFKTCILSFDLTGWPMRALQCKQLDVREEGQRRIASTHWSLVLPPDVRWLPANGRRTLPLRPTFPGFAINTIFYAAIVYALFAVPGAVRRRLRHKRGQCVGCGYPVGTSDVCSECGGAVAARISQRRVDWRSRTCNTMYV